MKLVFMGTPDFSVTILRSIYEAGYEILEVVTGEDKPKGRGRELAMPKVKEYALKEKLKVYQPHSLKDPAVTDHFKELKADIYVVAAYGKILPKELLELPSYGCVNVHASLLPKYRGAAPIQWAVINGDEESGVTIMQMNEGLDTGDIIMAESLKLAEDETGESLFERLSVLGGKLIVKALEKLEKKEIIPKKQDESRASYVGLLKKEMGRLDFNKGALELERMIRGLYSWPGAYFELKGKKIKVFKASVIKHEDDMEAGSIISLDKKGLLIKTGKDALNITEIQLEGKKRMTVGDFLLGNKIFENISMLG
ncbi:MAG: methionyl-tRNA formyltransferase [Lachnospiraceae bacterium]|nr:methionyl-tRNA formyltransferase [Lachnospiraceae bacterium]